MKVLILITLPILVILQNQAHVWADVAYQAVVSLGPALITAFVSWLAFRSQLKIKDKELDSQVKLKARELMFNAYQGLMERREKEAVEIGRVLGPLGVAFQMADNQEEQLKIRVSLMETMGAVVVPLRGTLDEIESQLKRPVC